MACEEMEVVFLGEYEEEEQCLQWVMRGSVSTLFNLLYLF